MDPLDLVHRQQLSEQHRVGAQHPAAPLAARRVVDASQLLAIEPLHRVAGQAQGLVDTAVNVDDIAVAGEMVQAVDVLRQQDETRDLTFDGRQSDVGRVGPGADRLPRHQTHRAPGAIGIGTQRVTRQGLDRPVAVLRVVVEATLSAVGADARLGRDSGSGDRADRVHPAEPFRQAVRKNEGLCHAVSSLPHAVLELLERTRPVLLQQAGEGAVGEKPSAGLTGRAVVGLVSGIDDSLDRRAAHGTGLAMAPVHGHLVVERSDPFGELLSRLAPQPVGPVDQGSPDGLVEPHDLFSAQGIRQLERRQSRAVQDLVRVGVADAAENAWVGQRALQRVPLAPQGRVETVEIRLEDLQATGVVGAQPALATHRVQGRALLAPGLGQQQRARIEIEDRQTQLARDLRTGLFPAQTTGDHQVDDEEVLGVQLDRDPLAQAPQSDDPLAAALLERRIDRAQDERAGEAHALQDAVDDTRLEGLEIDRDIGQLGHGRIVARSVPGCPQSANLPYPSSWPLIFDRSPTTTMVISSSRRYFSAIFFTSSGVTAWTRLT